MPLPIPAIEPETRFAWAGRTLEVYSHEQVVRRIQTGSFYPSGRGVAGRYSGLELFLAACGMMTQYARDVNRDHSLRRLVSYAVSGCVADPKFGDDPGGSARPWLKELALFHATVFQVLAPGTDTRAFVAAGPNPESKRRLYLRSRAALTIPTPKDDVAFDSMSRLLEDWPLEGPQWYVDLGGSRTVGDLCRFLDDAVAGRQHAHQARVAAEQEERARVDADEALDRLGAALEDLSK